MADKAVEKWFDSLPDDQKPVLEALRTLVTSSGGDVVEEFKWSRPCYSSGDQLFCYLHKTKNHATLGFQNGASLDDPKNLLEGTGKDMRHIKVKTLKDIDKPAFKKLLKQARTL